ncbi:UTP--glucose-1-phosphate uridylyltransferase, partial [bacterium]|nr:UTP--glucose-1-phosphate uridylyltransferase [bacterium]
MDITKVVIPSAGLGTQFMPFAKAIPQEMLPLIRKPAIQHVIEESIASGINLVCVITSKRKQAIANHFDREDDLQALLEEHDARNALSTVHKLTKAATFSYVRQTEPLGTGHAVMLAKHHIGKEYFGVSFPDDICKSKIPVLEQLMRVTRQERASIIAVQEVPRSCLSSYGVIGIKKQITPNLFQISRIAEKPHPNDAPSNLAVVGRYILSHRVFDALDRMTQYATQELQLTDAINDMIHHNERVFAYKMQGVRYDIGTPLGWIKAIIGTALQNPAYATVIKKFI